MKQKFKQIFPFAIILILSINRYLRNHESNISADVSTAIDIIMAVVSIVLFILMIKQDKENAKKKIILASAFVFITLIITFYFLNRN